MKNNEHSIVCDIQYVRLARYITVLLVAMYGIVPVVVDYVGLFEVDYALANFWFSISLLVVLLLLPNNVVRFGGFFSFSDKRKTLLTCAIFAGACFVFYLFPWHDDRESLGASISAFFRALWFVVAVSYLNSSERARTVLVFATVVLMYVDQSRTYFLLLLIILAAKSSYKKTALLMGVFLVVVLGAVRSSDSGGGVNLLLYGIVGEGYNATKAVGQIYQVSHVPIDSVNHLVSTFLQPVTLPLDLLFSKIFRDGYRLQDYYLSELVSSQLGEVFNPMGGWYIVADFIYYGYLGVFFLWLYIFITWMFSRALLDTKSFPFGAFFVFIAIKSTPFIYWKFVLYILVVATFYKLLVSFRLGLKVVRKNPCGCFGLP